MSSKRSNVKINYIDLTADNLYPHSELPVKNMISNSGQQYYQVQFEYEHGNEKVKTRSSLQIELCEMKVPYGLRSGLSKYNGKQEDSMIAYFDTKKEDQLCIQKLNDISAKLRDIFFEVRSHVGFSPKMSRDDVDDLIKGGIVYYPYDEKGEIPEGKQPSIYLKLFKRGTHPKIYSTMFTDLNGQEVPWNILISAELVIIPVISVNNIFVGKGKKASVSIQFELKSAVVVDLIPKVFVSMQQSTIDNYNKSHPEQSQILSEKLNKRKQELGSIEDKKEKDENKLPSNENVDDHPPFQSFNQNQSAKGELHDILKNYPKKNQPKYNFK